ncbi:hypothetical protein F5J12DRAFT_822249 [Pisolithus orientalis]|uniref:uncharacterized protein n=1 Tax=Pisolithus orientalis TaxID=936130 RepID=UPI002224A6C3|nr:uncharacterized protein F5J12DRAFT_822249 [Pisolithus orientalis]KAI6010875.1 hypothetical protein F5J12DRAFT_822249 [Pisolithus orientalis]
MKLATFFVFASAFSLAFAEPILGTVPTFIGAITHPTFITTSPVARQCIDVCCTIVSTVFGPPAWYCNPGTSWCVSLR